MAFIRDNLAVKGHIRTLILYPENGLPPFYVSHDASVHIPSINEVRKLPMYDTAVRAQGDIILSRVGVAGGGLFLRNTGNKIVACREIFDLSKQRRLGFLALSMDVSSIEGIYRGALLQDNEAMVMVGASGEIIAEAGTAPQKLLGSLGANSIPAEWRCFEAGGNGFGHTYYLSPKSNWDARIRRDLTLPILLSIALLISSWPLSVLVSWVISRPLARLYQSMNRFKEGDFKTRVLVEGNDEIAELSKTFNTMVAEIRELIDRNYVIVLREKESELTALQAQINPHFLYNVLDSLYWQATDSGQDKLAEDILALSDLFRLILSSGRSEIPVEQEAQIISNYLHIQKMRFQKKLDYHIDIAPEILSYPILKLVLQPFVENAVVHGLEHSGKQGQVRVSGKLRAGMLCFSIRDNGVGMDAEKIEELLRGRNEDRYYAVRNVKERLALRYGAGGRLEIQSRAGEGTEVCITIPAGGTA
jgi:two-component system sensor histidine kinase YesM